MIEKKILDKVLPLPDQEILKKQKIEELKNSGFPITNFNTGGIFYTLMMMVIKVRIELIELLRDVLNNCFVSHADEDWIELDAINYGMQRKLARKTIGQLTAKRTNSSGVIKVPKNTVFKTNIDINGEELRYFAIKDVIIPKDINEFKVEVEAEKEGIRYNVPEGLITKSLIFLEVDSITNTSDWITAEGADMEEMESFRSRVLNAWDEQATQTTAGKYKKAAESVDGVLFAQVNDQHPRGQGTVDIIITSTKGDATQQLLDNVKAAVSNIQGAYDDLIVKSSVNVQQPIHVKLFVPESPRYDDSIERAQDSLIRLLQISGNRKLNELNLTDIIFAIKNDNPDIRNIKVFTPSADVLLANDKVIVAGEICVEMERVY